MLKVILNRLKPQAEEIIAEEQAGFRARRSTTEQIFNLRILCEKYLQHQQNLYHVFIDFKKAFDRVWHAALWATMRKYNISANLVRTIEQLYDFWFSKDNPTGHSERKKKKRQTEEEVGRLSKSGQEWTLPAQLGQLKTGQDGKGLLRIHLWCPDDLPRLWDRIE